jgi:leader peptidase (prepilin peptidase) / N-methyltransferase
LINTASIILDILFLILIVICSITDIKKRIVPNLCIILLLILGIIKTVVNISIGYPWWFNLIGIVYSIPFFIAWHNNKMGAGDVKLIIVICLYLGIINSLIALILTLICLLVWAIYAKEKNIDTKKCIPLAPFIAVGFILFLFVKYLWL